MTMLESHHDNSESFVSKNENSGIIPNDFTPKNRLSSGMQKKLEKI
jgi:hypothetical protein